VTIDLVDEQGVLLGGIIAPGFSLSARALSEWTAQLPKVDIHEPKSCVGGSTVEAINNGLYYSAVGLLEAVTRRFAEELGRWPQLVVTGKAASMIKADCEIVDSWVSDLTVRGVVMAYQKHIADKADFADIVDRMQDEIED
jgi:type III pantothenate kinase